MQLMRKYFHGSLNPYLNFVLIVLIDFWSTKKAFYGNQNIYARFKIKPQGEEHGMKNNNNNDRKLNWNALDGDSMQQQTQLCGQKKSQLHIDDTDRQTGKGLSDPIGSDKVY